eukprot:5333466-Amphidinium_carterae.1
MLYLRQFPSLVYFASVPLAKLVFAPDLVLKTGANGNLSSAALACCFGSIFEDCLVEDGQGSMGWDGANVSLTYAQTKQNASFAKPVR